MISQSTNLVNLIKECQAEMTNDLCYLQNALNDDNVSVKAIKSIEIAESKKRARKFKTKSSAPKMQILSSTFSDEFTKSYSNVARKTKKLGTSKKFFASSNIATANRLRALRRKQEDFTYKHYDLYLLSKNPVEARRNVNYNKSSFVTKNAENIVMGSEKSNIQDSLNSTLNDSRSIFEPKFSSSPVNKEQKTSTPTKFQATEVNRPKIMLNCGSRLAFLNSTTSHTMSTSTNSYTYQNIQSFEFQNTSTPKVTRRLNNYTQPTIVLKECTFKEITYQNTSHSTLLSQQNMRAAIKCCFNPLRQLIKSNKNPKKLRKIF